MIFGKWVNIMVKSHVLTKEYGPKCPNTDIDVVAEDTAISLIGNLMGIRPSF